MMGKHKVQKTFMRYDHPLEAQRIALYVVKGVRPVSQFLKVLTRE